MNEAPIFNNHAEQCVIGVCMMDQEAAERVSFLSPDEFYLSSHKMMFSVVKDLLAEGEDINIVSMESRLDPELVPMSYIAEVNRYASLGSEVSYADIVRDMAIRRSLITKLHDVAERLADTKVKMLESVTGLSSELDGVIQSVSIGAVNSIKDLIAMTADRMESSTIGIKTGLKSGIEEVDDRLGDSFMAFGEITVVGGLSKNGKTLLANTINARLEMEENEVGHIFSIEMTTDAMFNSMISAKTGVPANFYRKQDYYLKTFPNDFDSLHGRWGAAAKDLYDSERFTFDGNKEVDADYICANMKKQAAIARTKGKVLRYVMIDHLHRMNFHNGNQPLTYAIRDAVRKIKNTASQLGVAVLLLAQLNNKAEGQNPTSFHILDSSSVRHELQAFVGIRMFRTEGQTYFGIFADSQRYGDSETKHHPAYMKLIGGVLRSLPQGEEHWTPPVEK